MLETLGLRKGESGKWRLPSDAGELPDLPDLPPVPKLHSRDEL